MQDFLKVISFLLFSFSSFDNIFFGCNLLYISELDESIDDFILCFGFLNTFGIFNNFLPIIFPFLSYTFSYISGLSLLFFFLYPIIFPSLPKTASYFSKFISFFFFFPIKFPFSSYIYSYSLLYLLLIF